MSPRPRIRKRANWPANLHEPRSGYYTWRDPRDGKTHILGRMPIEQAIYESFEANAKVANSTLTRSLAERMQQPTKTVADLLLKMTVTSESIATLKFNASTDKFIGDRLGDKDCMTLHTLDVATVLEEIKDRGKLSWAKAVRSRMAFIFAKGMALGWMNTNPARITEEIKTKVARQRLTLEQFNAIFKEAPRAAVWLQNAMLLALISGQDRMTISQWLRSSVAGDHVIVTRGKTNVEISIPMALRMDVVGISLAEVIMRCKTTGIVSKYLVHHVSMKRAKKRGEPVKPDAISRAFADARVFAGLDHENAPTFHEIRSLCKRLYMDQGNVDTKALLGHKSDKTANIYADARLEGPTKVTVKVG